MKIEEFDAVTRLTPLIGYDKAAELAMKAYETNKSIKEIVLESEMGNKSELVKILESDDK